MTESPRLGLNLVYDCYRIGEIGKVGILLIIGFSQFK